MCEPRPRLDVVHVARPPDTGTVARAAPPDSAKVAVPPGGGGEFWMPPGLSTTIAVRVTELPAATSRDGHADAGPPGGQLKRLRPAVLAMSASASRLARVK